MRLGALIIATSLLTLPLCLVSTVPPWMAAISWAIGALGMGMAVPSVAVQVMRLSPESDQGVNSAAIQIIDSVTVVLAVSCSGFGHAQAVASGGATATTYALLWAGSAVIALTAAIVAGRMRPLPIDIGG